MGHRVYVCETAAVPATKDRILSTWLTLMLLLPVSCGASVRILHHDIEAEIRPQEHAIAVVDVLTVALGTDPTHEPVGFFLHRDLALSEVSTVDRKVMWTVRDMSSLDALRAYFPTLDPAQSKAYAMAKYYQLIPAGQDVLKHEQLRLRLVYRGNIFDPLTPPAPHTPEPAQTTGVIEPRGTFLSGATFWVPHRPDGLFSFTLRTTFPEGYTSVSQGKRTMQQVADGVVRTEWQCPFPQQEIYLIAGAYVVTEERHGEVGIMTFLYNADPHLSHSYLSATRRYLDLYSRLIGPYPYPKFALVENYWQTGLGMPSFTLLGDQVIRLPFIVSTSYGHEILHNWWGNSVYVDWNTGNWSEGLTTYGADYLYQEMQSAQAARDYRKGILQDYLNYVHDDTAWPLNAFRAQHSRAARAIGYGKAAMVFHMLRRMVGEADYWAALRKFYQDARFQVASWDTIFSVFTAVTQRDFRAFKAQWIDQAGAPFISLDAVRLKQARPPYRLEVVISQSPAYDLDIPVNIQTERGTLLRHVTLQRPVHRVEFILDEKPVRVHVDPDFDVFRKVHRSELPPTIGQTLGLESVLIIVPSQGDPTMIQAYDRLARQWAQDKKYTVIKDADYTPALARTRAAWIFGPARVQDVWAQKLPADVSITQDHWRIAGATYDLTRHSGVLTLAHAENPDLTITWLSASQAQWVPVIGRKLLRYGPYSYVIFAADQATAMGVWPVPSSPMSQAVQ